MAIGGYGYNTTCLCFNLEIEDERICYEIFKKIGRKWKSFLLTVLMLKFPDHYENHIISENLEFFINKYSKDFDKKKSPNPIFIGWHSLEYDADQLTDILLNEHLRGGAKDFIVMLLKEIILKKRDRKGILSSTNHMGTRLETRFSTKPLLFNKKMPLQ